MLRPQDPRSLRRARDLGVTLRSASDGRGRAAHRRLSREPAPRGQAAIGPRRRPDLTRRGQRSGGARVRRCRARGRRGVAARRGRTSQAYRRHDLAQGGCGARAVDHRVGGSDGVQDRRRRIARDAGAAVRGVARHLGERPRYGAVVLGDGSPPDLLGAPAAQVCGVFRARRTERRVRSTAPRLYGPAVRLLARLQGGQARPRDVSRVDGPSARADRGHARARGRVRHRPPRRLVCQHPRAPRRAMDVRRPRRCRANQQSL